MNFVRDSEYDAMKFDRSKLSRELKAIIDKATTLPEPELAQFHIDIHSIWKPLSHLVEVNSPLKTRPRKNKLDEVQIKIVIDELQKLPDRQLGLAYLDSFSLKRKDLELIARSLTIYFSKDDNIQRLKENVLERTIGSRLNSQAIRGN